VLLSAEGVTGPQIAQRTGCTEPTVIKWRRSQPILPMRPHISERQTHDYPRDRHHEFLKFLRQVAAAYPGQDLHVLCGN